MSMSELKALLAARHAVSHESDENQDFFDHGVVAALSILGYHNLQALYEQSQENGEEL